MPWTTPGTATAGEVLTASFWNQQVRDNMIELAQLGGGATTDVSSTITFEGLTKGNADVKARYQQAGKSVWYWGYVTLGSTSSMSATSLKVSLPVTAVTGADAQGFMGSSWYVDTGTRGYPGVCSINSTTRLAFHHAESGNFGDVNGTNPFTWTANDYFRWSICYLAA